MGLGVELIWEQFWWQVWLIRAGLLQCGIYQRNELNFAGIQVILEVAQGFQTAWDCFKGLCQVFLIVSLPILSVFFIAYTELAPEYMVFLLTILFLIPLLFFPYLSLPLSLKRKDSLSFHFPSNNKSWYLGCVNIFRGQVFLNKLNSFFHFIDLCSASLNIFTDCWTFVMLAFKRAIYYFGSWLEDAQGSNKKVFLDILRLFIGVSIIILFQHIFFVCYRLLMQL